MSFGSKLSRWIFWEDLFFRVFQVRQEYIGPRIHRSKDRITKFNKGRVSKWVLVWPGIISRRITRMLRAGLWTNRPLKRNMKNKRRSLSKKVFTNSNKSKKWGLKVQKNKKGEWVSECCLCGRKSLKEKMCRGLIYLQGTFSLKSFYSWTFLFFHKIIH